jgi:hypothetical protein
MSRAILSCGMDVGENVQRASPSTFASSLLLNRACMDRVAAAGAPSVVSSPTAMSAVSLVCGVRAGSVFRPVLGHLCTKGRSDTGFGVLLRGTAAGAGGKASAGGHRKAMQGSARCHGTHTHSSTAAAHESDSRASATTGAPMLPSRVLQPQGAECHARVTCAVCAGACRARSSGRRAARPAAHCGSCTWVHPLTPVSLVNVE